MQSQRRPPRGGAEPRDPAGRRDPDVNRERLIYCCTSLVGHKVTAKLRGNILYEGVFHSCSLDGDFSITLRCARQLPSETCQSGELIGTLVIPGKDFLQVSAVDVPPPVVSEASRVGSSGEGFATDGEISKGKWSGGDRELVPWSGGETPFADSGGGLDDTGSRYGGGGAAAGEEGGRDWRQPWDQFTANSQMYGITTTFDEELYTTKLDPQSIPREKREEAERIAREIEGGPMASEVEDRLEGHEDEEAQFSAVPRSGGRGVGGRDPHSGNGSAASAGKGTGSHRHGSALPNESPATGSSVSQVALTREHLTQHDNNSGSGDGFALEHRTKRGMITAHSPMRPPMVSEMKRINALNLEPALPKLDDKTRSDWINFKQSQTRNPTKSVHGSGLKMEFQQSLEVINSRTLSKQQGDQATGGASTSQPSGAAPDSSGGASGNWYQRQGSMDAGPANAAGDSNRSKFSFNPAAKEFFFNPQAATFTPSGPSGAGAMSPQARAQGPQPQFPAAREASGHEAPRRRLTEMLEGLFERARNETTEVLVPEWTEAVGLSYREVLGRPSSAGPPTLPPPGGAAAAPGSWQQQVPGQMPTGAGPGPSGGPGPGGPGQMMTQGFLVAGPGQQGQMYPQMYPGGCGQRPPGGGQGGPGGMPQQQQQAQQQGQQQGQQPAGFGPQQPMMQPPGSVMVPAGMVNAQAGQMGPAPKFSAQVVPVVVPAGQYGQGFVPTQVQGQGQPGPGGGQPGAPGQQGQVMMQNPGGQIMMQPMYPRQQMGNSGSPPQMTGHEG